MQCRQNSAYKPAHAARMKAALRRCLFLLGRFRVRRCGQWGWSHRLRRLALLLNDALWRAPFIDHEVGQDAQDDEDSRQDPRAFFKDVGCLTRSQDLRGCAARGDSRKAAALARLKQYEKRQYHRDQRNDKDNKYKHGRKS